MHAPARASVIPITHVGWRGTLQWQNSCLGGSKVLGLAIALTADGPTAPTHLPMSERHSLRIAIQQIESAQKPCFRILAYGERRSFGHADFATLEELITTLQAALPDFTGWIIDSNTETSGSIVFTGNMELDEGQLRVLGLRPTDTEVQ